MRILVALSGGIDSSTVAHMLAEQGHELIGVRFTLWSDPLAPALAEILPNKCCNAQTAARAAATAKALKIPLHIVDLSEEFKRAVVDPFLAGYRAGKTPNPCIGCNRSIKFGKLLSLMEELHCERLATGHYARTATEELSDGSTRMLLLEAEDERKDQSYYLYGLTQEQLARAVFPLGTMRKAEVYALAKRYDVPYDEYYRESQDLCFFPEKTPEQFLRRHLTDALKPGKIVRRDGTVVGDHEGLPLYTVGQRRGLGIGGLTIPLEVVSKDSDRNELVVAERGEVHTDEVTLTDLRFVSWIPEPGMEHAFECRLRSLSPRRSGTLSIEGNTARFSFPDPVSPQAPGQALVLYRGREVVGGGTMG
ncbi:MAG: tRNA 2-thiouridine(34) synthase MnmA [Candidatus Peregrinibacteria bacterium]|nr:tRNA 2-thiouridine(34) synthase MnmA [Candidatus Peregrinibacteria bacterium]